MKPSVRPNNPCFSSGPCAKRPGWTPEVLRDALVGRSHRSGPGKARLKEVIDRTRSLLDIPADYRIAIVPASDTGAVELAMWSLLGERGVDLLAWESFGKGWVTDVRQQLRLSDARVIEADYGYLPDLGQVDFSRDVVFVWNGTTSGVRVPDGDWIPADRAGLTICDATSAVFAMHLPWDKLDVVTWSWQKVMGGEAAHGMLVLSPRAVQRLESYTPPWPLPKLFRLTKGGKVMAAVFVGEPINTPSMLRVEDRLGALAWHRGLGGLSALQARADANAGVIYDWATRTSWLEPLPVDLATRSNTSVCLKVVDPAIAALPADAQRAFVKQIEAILDKEGAAHDIAGHRDAPPHLRIWCGCTVEASDLEILTGWLDWAFAEARRQSQSV